MHYSKHSLVGWNGYCYCCRYIRLAHFSGPSLCSSAWQQDPAGPLMAKDSWLTVRIVCHGQLARTNLRCTSGFANVLYLYCLCSSCCIVVMEQLVALCNPCSCRLHCALSAEQIPRTSIIKAGCSTAACTLQMCAALRGASQILTSKSHTRLLSQYAHTACCVTSALLHRPMQ